MVPNTSFAFYTYGSLSYIDLHVLQHNLRSSACIFVFHIPRIEVTFVCFDKSNRTLYFSVFFHTCRSPYLHCTAIRQSIACFFWHLFLFDVLFAFQPFYAAQFSFLALWIGI